MDLISGIQQELNFTFELVGSPDGEWGRQREDGSWSGFVGQLMGGEADANIAGLTIFPARRAAIDFSVPIVWTDQSIFIANPSDEVNFLTYFTPLKWANWAVIAGLMGLGTLGLAAAARWAVAEANRGEFTVVKSFTFRS